MPTSMGYHDAAVPLARRSVVSQDWGEHLIASPFGTIEPATFRYARPIGTAMPRPPGYQLASFDVDADTGNAWSPDIRSPASPATERKLAYPRVDHWRKGDRLPSAKTLPTAADPRNLPQLQPVDAAPAAGPRAAAIVEATRAAEIGVLGRASTKVPEQAADAIGNEDIAELPPEIPAAGDVDSPIGQQPALTSLASIDEGRGDRSGQIYFDTAAMGSLGGLERWSPGAEPVMVRSAESGIKVSALEGRDGEGPGGETLAGKDDATRMQSPAQRLKLSGRARVRAEKCLADAVYFEARGEPYEGQEAVAQVVMNRVFSGYYPRNVCGVVYQNASHYLACQFTFACEGRNLSRIDEPEMWAQAKRIAQNTLDGRVWLADIGHATHYHAYWVHPRWVHEMRRVDRIGVHTFYRPRAWGDGGDEPVWGAGPKPSKIDPKPVSAAKGHEAQSVPVSDGSSEATAKL